MSNITPGDTVTPRHSRARLHRDNPNNRPYRPIVEVEAPGKWLEAGQTATIRRTWTTADSTKLYGQTDLGNWWVLLKDNTTGLEPVKVV